MFYIILIFPCRQVTRKLLINNEPTVLVSRFTTSGIRLSNIIGNRLRYTEVSDLKTCNRPCDHVFTCLKQMTSLSLSLRKTETTRV